MKLLDRLRGRRKRRRCEHEWGPASVQPGRSGYTMVRSCLHCEEEQREATSRRKMRRTAATRPVAWQAERKARRSAFKGIFTTDDAYATGVAVEKRLRLIDKELLRRIGVEVEEPSEQLEEAA